MNTKHNLILLLLFLSLNLNAQTIDPASLPEVEDYIQIMTNPDADTCILALHGGPTDDLFTGNFYYLEQIPTFSVVEVKKHEMLTPVLNNDSLTFEQGEAVNDTTAALIEKAVQYFNDEGKTVVLVGHSWGAIVLGEYMDDYGVDNVHRIIPMEGRLSMPPAFVDYLLDGWLPTFGLDGVSLELSSPQYSYNQGLLTLAAAIFDNRWIDSLANLDLSNMMYTYAENDVQTGPLLPEETAFVEDSGAQLLFIPNAGHGASFLDEYQAQIVDFIRGEIFVEVNENFAAQELKLFPTLADEWIQIESNQKGSLHIYDLTGRVVYHGSDLEFPLNVDVSNFVNGQYIAVLQDGAEQGISTAKFQVFK